MHVDAFKKIAFKKPTIDFVSKWDKKIKKFPNLN